jgi:Methane oxygenase PmoA
MKPVLWCTALACSASLAPAAPEIVVKHDLGAKTVTVYFDTEVMTEFVYNTYAKPIVWPLRGPGGVTLTRDWPMKPDTAGESKDHPHHKSVWFTHGAVNGVDFWSENDKAGKVVTQAVTKAAPEAGAAVIESRNHWVAPGGEVVCADVTTIRCGLEGEARFLDFEISITASSGDVTFGDTKEGTMAIRTRPELNLEANKLAAGRCVNSEGLTGKALWGQRARWVDYWAPVQGKVLGIALLDHPGNLRHPTTWHAREYGLIAANPFGLHDFSKGKAPKNAGDFILKAGHSQKWRYRLLLHSGDAQAAAIEGAWKKWAAGK